MSTHENWSKEERERLLQELLELHFGCHENPEALQARLDAEPALRELQKQALAEAAVLKAAVQPEQQELPLREPRRAGGAARNRGAAAAGPARWVRTPWRRLTLAASAAALFVLGALVFERVASHRVEAYRADHLRVTLSAPRAVPVGAEWSFTVQASDLAGAPADCRVRWQTFTEQDRPLASGEAPLQNGATTIAAAASDLAPRRLEVVASRGGDEVRQTLELVTAVPGPLVHVTTDRPVYRPGETVFARAVALDRVTLQPAATPATVQARLLDAKNAPVAVASDLGTSGAAGFELVVPRDSAGGVHRVEVSSPEGTFAPESLEIVVRPFQNPQLHKTVVLDRATYAPGARGAAAVRAERLGGAAAAGAIARGALVLDGAEVWHEERPLDGAGEARFAFTVPTQVKAGAARFLATITDGGVVETEVKPFVVPTGRVLAAAFPEGGDLVAGVENRVYLECTDPLGRYVDTTGAVVDDRGDEVAKFTTEHQGRARVVFVPRGGRSYSVRLAGQPQDAAVALPAVAAQGVVLALQGDEVGPGLPLRVAVRGRGDGPWLLGVFCRGALVGQTTLRAGDDGELGAVAEVPVPTQVVGVLRVTVFDRRMQPVAERLVRRAAAQRVQVELACEKGTLQPGDSQQVTVKTKDEAGRAVAAIVGLCVTDLAATSLGSEPRIGLADGAALFADVERTEQLGDFLLGNPAGAHNADLLLGTRGWRKFVWRNDAPAKQAIQAHAAYGPFAANLLAREGFGQTPQVASNGDAAQAGATALVYAHREAEGRVRDALGFSLMALLGLVLLEGLVQGLRSGFRSSPLPLLAAAGAVFLGGWFTLDLLRPNLLSARLPVAEERAEFAWGEKNIANWRFQAPEAPRIVDREAVPMLHDQDVAPDDLVEFVAEANQDPAANPLAGAFFNDGGDGDIRARAGNNLHEGFLELGVGGWDDREVEAAKERADFDGLEKRRIRRIQQRSRVYAHQHVASDDRRDFAPTIYWNARLETDASGEAKVSFGTSDAVTTWVVTADAHVSGGSTGRLGQAEARFTAQLPFHLEAKLPDEVSCGDELDLPIAASTDGGTTAAVELRIQLGQGLHLRGSAPFHIELQNGRGRALLPIAVEQGFGTATVSIEGRAGRFTDRVQQTLRIAPRGFPHRRSSGGSLEAGVPGTLVLAIPVDALPGSGHAVLKVFPSPLTALTEGLQGLLQEPCGCFEQASSSNYPNTLVLSLLQATGDDVPTLAARARDLLPRGYAKIAGYECKERGYEWFGGDPGHEALTAYGLLEFTDMAAVHPVDAAMVARTRDWLLGRRDGNGGFQRNPRALDRFGGAPQPITNAYVTYALLVAGVPAATLAKELDALQARAGTDDAYELALIACALQSAQRDGPAAAARARLATLQHEDGSLHGTTTSITSSGGQDLVVETTGFALLAWLGDPAHIAHVRDAVRFLQGARGGSGTFGATQATIVALRALTAYAQQNRATKAPGTVRVKEGERVLAERSFPAGAVDAVTFELWPLLTSGPHTLQIELEGGGGAMPWACDVTYHAEQPADDPDTAVSVRTKLRAATVREGETVALDVELENRTARGLPMTMVIVGLPAGLELPTRVLEDLQKAQQFAFWELRGRELALYWRDLEPEGKRTLSLDLVGRVPGRSAGPASRGYLYYTPQQKRWAAPLGIDVTAR